MPALAQQHLVIDNLSKGLNTYDPASRVAKGYYVDAQNMLLTNKSPVTVGGLTKFNTTPAPNDEVIVWFEPYTAEGSSTTEMVVATDAGTVYSYDLDEDEWTTLRVGLDTEALIWSHVPFRGKLLMSNGSDPILKYDGSTLIPVGARSVATMSSTETWYNTSLDTARFREGTSARKISTDGNVAITGYVDFSTSKNLEEGIDGGDEFANTDLLSFKLFVEDATAFNNATTLGQSIETARATSFWIRQANSAGNYDRAQRFIAPTTGYTSRAIHLFLWKTGLPTGNLTLTVETDSATLPSGTPVSNGTSDVVGEATVSSDEFGWVEFIFSSTITLAANTAYWLVLRSSRTPDGSNYIQWGATTNITGHGMSGNTSADPTVWSAMSSAYSHMFRTYTLRGPLALFFYSDTLTPSYYVKNIVQPLVTGWQDIEVEIGGFSVANTPTWSSINRVAWQVTSLKNTTVTVDDLVVKYLDSPVPGGLIEMYNQQLVVAGIENDLVAIQYSDAGVIDQFNEDNVARFSGGRHALEKTDQITALHAYFDELIVGKVNSAWTFSGTGENVSISALPLTIGMDAHRAIVETPWALHFLFENNIFGARLTSRGLVSSNISSLLQDLDGNALEHTVAIRQDRSHTVRWGFRTTDSDDENDLGLIYDYQLDAWCSRYTPAISYYTKAIVDGNREILCSQYDGYIRRVDVGTSFDGTPIVSYVTMPYLQSENAETMDNVVRWVDWTVYVKGTADVLVEARFADEPHEFETATFTTFGTVKATPDGDKGYGYFGQTARWIQLRLRALAGSFEVMPPCIIGYNPTGRRV